MFTTATNYHHSYLPALGEIHKVPKGLRGEGRKLITESYNLSDNVLPYSIGQHIVNVRFLDDGTHASYAGHWFKES